MTKNARITTGLLSKAKRGDFDQFLIGGKANQPIQSQCLGQVRLLFALGGPKIFLRIFLYYNVIFIRILV